MSRQLTKGNGNSLRSAWPAPFSLRPEWDDFFNRMWGGDTGGWMATDKMAPILDLSETEDAYRADIDLPGVAPEEIDIQVNGNVLTVSGTRKDEKEEKGRTHHRIERSTGSFSRTVTLPCDINEEHVAAGFENGVLTVELPKAAAAKPRKIKIKS